jgi:hypothetical protein
LVDVALANAHLDGIPANGSPGPQLLADLFNKPIEEMRAAKEAEVELPERLKREATAEETARIAQNAKDASPEREIVVRKTPVPKADRSGTKIATVIEKAKTTGITMAQVREMTGWSKTSGFYGAIKRAGLQARHKRPTLKTRR